MTKSDRKEGKTSDEFFLTTKDSKEAQRTQSQDTDNKIFALFAENLCDLCG
jgi:hypothetical protein